MAEVKICGITDPEALQAALDGAAAYVGLVFFPKSPRNIDFNLGQMLSLRARGKAQVVAVTVNADDALLETIHREVGPDYIQAHGMEPPRRLSEMRRFAKRGIIKAISIGDAADVARGAVFAQAADMLLFDAKAPPGADRPGGNAVAFDWHVLQGSRLETPWMLSGGLNSENISAAIRASGAQIVDVSSGVESAPGIKDPTRITAFLAAASANSA